MTTACGARAPSTAGESTTPSGVARRTASKKANGKEYGEGDVVVMGTDVVHSIENPLRTNNAALHVFAGNLFTTPHRQWDVETLQEAPFDNAYMMSAYPGPRRPGGGDGPDAGRSSATGTRPPLSGPPGTTGHHAPSPSSCDLNPSSLRLSCGEGHAEGTTGRLVCSATAFAQVTDVSLRRGRFGRMEEAAGWSVITSAGRNAGVRWGRLSRASRSCPVADCGSAPGVASRTARGGLRERRRWRSTRLADRSQS